MENHPIPQDVTGFQFKLIGEMTVKQFAYLASGAICAWLFFVLPIPFVIKFPLVLISGSTGAIFAFIPISGRPADVMATYFLKALFTPNQFFYQKTGRSILSPLPAKSIATTQVKKQTSSTSQEKLQLLLSKLPKKTRSALDEKETVFLKSLSDIMAGKEPIVQTTTASDTTPRMLSVEELQKAEESQTPQEKENFEEEQKRAKETLEKEALLIQKELEQAKIQEASQQQTQGSPQAHEKVTELEKQLQETLAQKERLEQQLLALQQKLNAQKQEVFTPSIAKPKAETQNVRKVPQSMAKNIGVPMNIDVPNLIAGVVKDPRGNILPNILVEVKDKEGNPVRAFKTNGLGQFLSATPLLNGVYTIEFEDPEGKQKFDAVEIIANGEIIPAIEVISHDEREELRKALFN